MHFLIDPPVGVDRGNPQGEPREVLEDVVDKSRVERSAHVNMCPGRHRHLFAMTDASTPLSRRISPRTSFPFPSTRKASRAGGAAATAVSPILAEKDRGDVRSLIRDRVD